MLTVPTLNLESEFNSARRRPPMGRHRGDSPHSPRESIQMEQTESKQLLRAVVLYVSSTTIQNLLYVGNCKLRTAKKIVPYAINGPPAGAKCLNSHSGSPEIAHVPSTITFTVRFAEHLSILCSGFPRYIFPWWNPDIELHAMLWQRYTVNRTVHVIVYWPANVGSFEHHQVGGTNSTVRTTGCLLCY